MLEHSNKWYIYNPESVLENEMYTCHWDFEIQAEHLISAIRPDLVIGNKKENMPNSGFYRPGGPQSKIKRKKKKRDKYLELARELKKKIRNMKVTVIPVVISALGTIPKRLVQGL